MGGKGGAVCATVCRQSDERVRPLRGPDAHGAIPAARAKGILCYKIPGYTEYFAIMLFPVLNGEVVECAVEELNAAVAGGG